MKPLLLCCLLFFSFTHAAAQSDHDHGDCWEGVDFEQLRAELEARYETDQNVRQRIMASPTFDKALSREMEEVDKENTRAVREMLDDYGWLPASRIGEKAADALFLIVQHADQATLEKYFPYLRCQALQGEAKATHAAMMEDRLLMYQGKAQLYGTQAKLMTLADGSQKMMIWPVKEAAGVNWRRTSAGFTTTVEENAERLRAGYDADLGLPE